MTNEKMTNEQIRAYLADRYNVSLDYVKQGWNEESGSCYRDAESWVVFGTRPNTDIQAWFFVGYSCDIEKAMEAVVSAANACTAALTVAGEIRQKAGLDAIRVYNEIVVLAAKDYEAAIARVEVAYDEAREAAKKAYHATLAKVD